MKMRAQRDYITHVAGSIMGSINQLLNKNNCKKKEAADHL
jgi:hypothetical protein